jgi:uncharacterized protein YdeI (YjbR/CyaY-like superfamily)
MITEIEDYFSKGCGRCDRFATSDCSTRRWNLGLAQLRQICLGMELIEAVKWGHPCYMHGGRNIVIIGALRDDFRLSFFNAALMKDPHEVQFDQGSPKKLRDQPQFSQKVRDSDFTDRKIP